MPDSLAAGWMTGGLFGGWRRNALLLFHVTIYSPFLHPIDGLRGVFSGSLVGSAGCLLVQLALNEAEVQRMKFLSRQLQTSAALSVPNASTPEPPVPQESLLNRVIGILGMSHMSDERYLEKMKKERDMHLKRIEELEQLLSRDGEN